MKNLLILAGLIATTLCMAGSADTIPASDNLIKYTGRIDFSNPDAPKFSYSGVSIRACFTGTSIGMIMNDNVGQNYYNLILDGKILDTLRISTGKKTYKIAEGLENKTHEIEIFKRTEEMFGKTQFYGFVVDAGSNLSAITNPREKLIEFIGNSITCGYGNEGVNGGTFGPTTENHYLTFAAITSRNFNARHLAVCKSGIGIYRNYNGPAAGNADCMTNNYTRIFINDENPKYSFTDKPDLVCIDLGTNDFSTTGGDSAKFVNNYFRLIDTIQIKYIMPDIICLLGPMMSGSTLSMVRKYLEFIADSANNKGKGNVYFFEMSPQNGDLGIGIDYHPTVAQHQKNAQEFTGFIKSLKNWKINPLVVNTSVVEASRIKIEFNTSVQDTKNDFSGFEVFKNGQSVAIDSICPDSTDSKILHIVMQQPLGVGEKINISYEPGTIETIDSVSLSAINYIDVTNYLTETKITKAYTSKDGLSVFFVFNKKLNPNSDIDGLSITDSRGVAELDSFMVASTQLTIYLQNNLIKKDSVFASYNGSGINGTDNIVLGNISKMIVSNASTYVSDLSENNLNSISIFPNPNKTGTFYYRLDNSLTSEKTELEVYDATGALVYRQIIKEPEGKVELTENTNEGIYIFKFSLDKFSIIKSVVIE